MSYILGLVSQVKQAYLGSLFGLYGEGNISDPDTTKTNPDATKTTFLQVRTVCGRRARRVRTVRAYI